MRGTLVILRAYLGQPIVRKVWDANERVVYITNDEYFERLMAGADAPLPVGFPIDDVFQYDPELAGSLEILYQSGAWDWGKLKKWRPA